MITLGSQVLAPLAPLMAAQLRELGVAATPELSATYALLHGEWRLPPTLTLHGLLLAQLEQSPASALQAVPLDAAGAQIAVALRAVAALPRRAALRPVEPFWQLAMLACAAPEAAALALARLLARLRSGEPAPAAEQLVAVANIARRLGIWEARAELLNRHVQLTRPQLAQHIQRRLDQSAEARAVYFAAIAETLRGLLVAAGVPLIAIERRECQLYQVADSSVESSWGEAVGADRLVILLADGGACYAALGVLNGAFPVLGARLRDYIGGPKENGYQAIHTSILAPDAERARALPLELRLCTPAMDNFNRRGIVELMAGRRPSAPPSVWWADEAARHAVLRAYAECGERIFVFTPMGVPVGLPRGATVIDFAVRVHSDLGVFCRGALLNGQRVPPGEPLECGDLCEVLHEPDALLDESQLRSATTATARAKVRKALQRGSRGAEQGRLIFERVLRERLQALGLSSGRATLDQQLARFCREQAYERPEAFYQSIARGEAAPDKAVGSLVEHLLTPRLRFDALPPGERARLTSVMLGRCCWPAPGVETVAALVEKRGSLRARVHRADCPSLAQFLRASGVRTCPVAWDELASQGVIADVTYEGRDEPGLIAAITSDIDRLGEINIREFHAAVPSPHLARLVFVCETRRPELVAELQRVLRERPGQRRVAVSEQPLHADALRIMEPLSNPYRALPSVTWPLFVGRENEIARIVTQLSDPQGDPHMLVRGPKRIGKSSLLHNLAEYHLHNFRRPVLVDLLALRSAEVELAPLLRVIAGRLVEAAGSRLRVRPPSVAALRSETVRTFGRFLEQLRAECGPERFVVLIDEFGLIGAHFSATEADNQVRRWRGLLADPLVRQHLSLVIAMPDVAYHQLGAICTSLRLDLLSQHEARDLIVSPVRAHLAYQPAELARILAATGNHPFYTHLVCREIVTQLLLEQRRAGVEPRWPVPVTAALVEQAIARVRASGDSFYHIERDSKRETVQVLSALAAQLPEGGTLSTQALRALHWWIDHGVLASAAADRRDLISYDGERVGLRAGLVAAWLREQGNGGAARESA